MEIQNITQLKTYLAETVEKLKQIDKLNESKMLSAKNKNFKLAAQYANQCFGLRKQLPKLPHFEQMLAVVEKLTPSS